MCCAGTDAAQDGATKEGKPPPVFGYASLLVALSFEQHNADCLYFGNGCNFQ